MKGANTDQRPLIVNLKDTAQGRDGSLAVVVAQQGPFLELSVPGYGDCASEPGCGHPTAIEYYDGALRLVVFADINSEEPTHIISLEGARESRRRSSSTDHA